MPVFIRISENCLLASLVIRPKSTSLGFCFPLLQHKKWRMYYYFLFIFGFFMVTLWLILIAGLELFFSFLTRDLTNTFSFTSIKFLFISFTKKTKVVKEKMVICRLFM